MLDLFRDIYAEMNGFDMEKVKEEKKEKKEKKQANKILLSRDIKIIVYIMGILYLIIAISSLVIIFKSGHLTFAIAKYLFLALLDIAIVIFMSIKSKRTEIMAISGIVLFIIMNVATSFILF